MLPITPFVNPAVGTREHNAIAKALQVRPRVIHLYDDANDAFYLVKRIDKQSKYVVRLFQDADGQCFGECACRAANPPVLKETNLIAWEPLPCVHLAATLLFIAEKDKCAP